MRIRAPHTLVCIAAAALLAAPAVATASPAHRTPNDCIRLNGGDYNACNVGHSGRGDLPYRPVQR